MDSVVDPNLVQWTECLHWEVAYNGLSVARVSENCLQYESSL